MAVSLHIFAGVLARVLVRLIGNCGWLLRGRPRDVGYWGID